MSTTAYWLVKTEPGDFSYDDLVRLKRDRWDGVRNPGALKNMRSMHPGDLAFVYHTGDERRIVGICRVVSEPYPDPRADDPRWVVVDVEPVERVMRPITLAEIKADPTYKDWELVRQGRLSVMPVPEAIWQRLQG
ncbi:MAG TPA: EVE domain-containing protein [Bacillota bacterium]|nr:EVE domain-containing protein [Bacillota bacterium]